MNARALVHVILFVFHRAKGPFFVFIFDVSQAAGVLEQVQAAHQRQEGLRVHVACFVAVTPDHCLFEFKSEAQSIALVLGPASACLTRNLDTLSATQT